MSERVSMSFDKYVTFLELTDYLQETAREYPGLSSLESAGKSYEGRDIWAMTLTNWATGEPDKKPAIYIDGNIHAGEVTGSAVALYLIHYLVTNFGLDDEVTHLMNTRTFYVLPRVNPDGAELYLTSPTALRSSVRVWPDEEICDLPGLHRADVNGDGKILQMRVRDDQKGEWKVSQKDPRLMIPRRPGERKGPFYRFYPEGFIKDYEGEPIPINRTPFGLDLNRNFPSNWDTEVPGGGDYPTAEPEPRAILDFIIKHPNIGAVQALHTSGGFYYRNPCQYPEDKMDPDDLRATKDIAREGTVCSGYPDMKSPNRSTLTEWAYEHRGLIAYTTELWNRYSRAGIDLVDFRTTVDPDKKEDMQVKLLVWNDRELAGKGFVPWTPFDHPQLGAG
jgi:murein tripeptide amidase MpaA